MKPTRETLVAHLRQHGVTYLAPSDAVAAENIPSADALLVALLEQPDARLQLAMVPLFLRQPELARSVTQLAKQLAPPLALDLQTLYMAAVYLQRLWKTRLGFYLDNTTLLPDLFSQELALPPADERFGKTGLYELADAWKARSRYPFDRLASFNNTMDLFFEQLKLEYPLPADYRERSQFVGRYGQLDVFHFDLYSTALSKVERGTENDFADVLALLQADRLEMATLIACFNEILPRYATESLKQDPAEFQRKFAILVEMWNDLHNS